MKNIITYTILAIAILVNQSCVDLAENPLGRMAPEGFFKTEEDVQAAVNGAYAEWITAHIESELFFKLMLRSDMADIGDRNTLADRITVNDFNMDAENDFCWITWNRMYQSVSAANTAIKGARGIEADQNVKDELEAKARFIRAFTYFHLVRVYSEVPYLDEPIESAEAMDAITQSSEAEIYDNIIADLVFCKEHLPVSYPSNIRNIGTQGAAATMLADVYLTLGMFDEAATEARFVINNAGTFDYSLAQDYQDLYNADVVRSLKEPIFTYELKNTLSQGQYNPDGGMINLTRIRDLAPRSLSVAVPSLAVYNSWDNRDYRKKVCFEDSVMVDGVKTALVDLNIRVPRPHIAKYFRYPGPQEKGDDRSSDHLYSMYRFADVLLIAAEAIAETEGATAEAIGYFNQIRSRARFNGVTTTDYPEDVAFGINTQDFIDAIREERRLEFAFEFKRWYDIKRWGILEETFTGSSSLEPHPVDPNRDYLFPLPQGEIDVTGFEQNPGY